jgi:hypothetical protein
MDTDKERKSSVGAISEAEHTQQRCLQHDSLCMTPRSRSPCTAQTPEGRNKIAHGSSPGKRIPPTDDGADGTGPRSSRKDTLGM